MDSESWLKGYETGVMLHNHMRDGTPIDAPPLASVSVTSVISDLQWFADLSGVLTLTNMKADYSGNVTASYSYDGVDFTEPVSMAELLAVNPAILFSGLDPSEPYLYFRFHLADANANLTAFQIYGIPKAEG